MQFIGASLWAWGDEVAYKIRNKTNQYVVPTANFLDKHKDPRYFEFYLDFANQIHVRRPAGTQELLERPYTIITRQVIKGTDVYELVSKDYT